MSRDILIGLDAGTSVIKAVAFDLAGRQLAVAGTRNQYRSGGDGAVEGLDDLAELRRLPVLQQKMDIPFYHQF